MSAKFANVGETVYFHFGSNDTSGSGDDGATPLCDVRLMGAAAGAAPVYSLAPILLTHGDYPDGCHEVAIVASVGNGFADGSEYAVFCTLTVDAQNPTGFVGSFKLGAVLADVVAVDGTAQRATDLAEIAQYLFANSATLTDIIADNSAFAQMLATSGDISGFAALDDSQQSIRDAITASAPVEYNPDASSVITTGNQDSGTFADTASDNQVYWDIGDTGTGILVVCEINMGPNRSATEVRVNGYFSSGALRVVEIYAWNYTLGAYVKFSAGTAATEMRNRASDQDYSFSLSEAYTDHTTTPGEVKIKFEAAQSNGGDTLKLDHVVVTGVASGSTSLDAFADAVWKHDILGTISEGSAGYFLRFTRVLVTDVAAGDTDTSFTLSAGCAVNDCYNGMLLMIEDETDDHYEVRRIVDWTSGLVMTVDRALGFTPVAGDHVYIMATGYADVNTTHLAATAQTARDIGANVLLSAGSGAGQLDFTSGVVKSNLAQILGTALTETAGLIAAGFKKFFNIATPLLTVENAIDAAGTAAGLHGVTDGLVTAVPAAVFATTGITALGTETFAELVQIMASFTNGKVVIAGNAWTFYDTDGTTPLFTLTLTTGGRTVT